MAAVEIIDVHGGQARSQLILGARGVTLVDTGSDIRARAIAAALASVGFGLRDIRLIVLTHGDGDHLAGAHLLQDESGADVLTHELEVEYVLGRLPARFPIAKRAFHFLSRRLPRPRVTRQMSGPRLVIGDIEIVHTPGHTPGHLVVYAGDALCAGDAFRTGYRFTEVPSLMTVDRAMSRTTIRMLAGRAVIRAYSGHGPPSHAAAERLRDLADRLPGERRTP